MSYSLSAVLKRLFLRRQRPQPIRRSFRPKLEACLKTATPRPY